MSIFKILLKKIFTAINIALLIGSGFMYGLFGNHGAMCNFENVKLWSTSPESGFEISLSKEFTSEGRNSLKVVYPASGYPSINTKKLPHLWWNYRHFAIDIYNPQTEKVNFVVRLEDMRGNRANIKRSLSPGWNNVIVSRSEMSRVINSNLIKFIVLFLDQPKSRITLYFDNMRLSRPQTTDHRLQTRDLKSMRPFIHTEVFEPMAITPALPAKGAIKVYVAKLSDEKKIEVLVSGGIPFAPGQLFNEKNLSILDMNGNEIPIAAKVLARWPYDNSIRSVLVQFPTEIPHKYKQVILRWGEPRTVQDIGLTEVSWVSPEASVLLPGKWLCLSKVIGDQVPVGAEQFVKYDQNIKKAYPDIKEIQWSNDVGKDGYYDTPHTFYQLYVRTGNDEYLKSARKEAVHLRDDQIIQNGPDRGKAVASSKTRVIYIEGLIDDYLLTGDARSLKVAGYMAKRLKKAFKPSSAFFPKNGTHFWTEREAAFPLLETMAYYELTGDKEYLKYAGEIVQNLYKTQAEWPERGGFIHNLYSHDPEEGARRDEYGGSPFMTGLLLEGIVKYHQLTGSNIAKDSIFRALDWLMSEAIAPDGDTFIYLTCDALRDEGHPDLNMLLVHAFGYGYKISGYARNDYLELGKKLFDCGANNARLGDRKHFNQNYRSSGHFLAYIDRPQTVDQRPETTPRQSSG
jgi:hypothetical protein